MSIEVGVYQGYDVTEKLPWWIIGPLKQAGLIWHARRRADVPFYQVGCAICHRPTLLTHQYDYSVDYDCEGRITMYCKNCDYEAMAKVQYSDHLQKMFLTVRVWSPNV